tara:strand:+ start:71 stop:592 length:522 start_codon:yes stop_codon:yes gene_type:complete
MKDEKFTIHQKISLLQSEIGGISKDAKNPFYKSKYFDVNSLIKQLTPLLQKYGLVLLQPINSNKVNSIICDLESNEVVESSLELPTNLDPQKLGSAITYYRRYTLQSLLALQAVDDDANLTVKKLPPLLENTPAFKTARQRLMTGSLNMAEIKTHYTVETDVQEKLLNFKLNK